MLLVNSSEHEKSWQTENKKKKSKSRKRKKSLLEHRQKVKDECAKLHDEIFVLRSKTTSAAAEKRQGRTISLPGTPAEKHGYVMNNKSLTYNQSNIKKNNKNNNNNNVSSALSNGAMFAKRLWLGATSDTTSKTKKSQTLRNIKFTTSSRLAENIGCNSPLTLLKIVDCKNHERQNHERSPLFHVGHT